MLSRFLLSHPVSGEAPVSVPSRSSPAELMNAAGGRSYSDGLYRIHSPVSARAANVLVTEAFPDFAGRIDCFGYDWLGRQFSADSRRGSTDDPEVLMFEPGTGEALEIPVAFSRLHNEELVDYAEAALAVGFFDEWRRAGGSVPSLEECVGYRTPLFLGGVDGIENLEVSDIETYWTLLGQLRVGALGLGPS